MPSQLVSTPMEYASDITDITFSSVPKGTVDPDQVLKDIQDSDHSPEKVSLSAGVYRDAQGNVNEFEVVRKAKKILMDNNMGHDYNPIYGVPGFQDAAQKLQFGAESELVANKQIATFQTIAGCGANRLGAAFLKQHYPLTAPYETPSPNSAKVYIGTPAWGNHIPLFLHAGFEVETYNYFSPSTLAADFSALVTSLNAAPEHSIFVLQACCHNPTGADYSQAQWTKIAAIMKRRNLFPFFDSAYQGFGTLAANGGADDAWAVRYFAAQGLDMVVCQSFSKNFGLYGERVGALHVLCRSPQIATNVLDQIRCLVRWEYSSPPGFGARLVTMILSTEGLREQWEEELGVAAAHIVAMRKRLAELLAEKLATPGEWNFILNGKGLFSFFPLGRKQIEVIMQRFHIYFPFTGRINMAGLNDRSVEKLATAIDDVVRNVSSKDQLTRRYLELV